MKKMNLSTLVEPFEAAAELHTERRTWRLISTPTEGHWFEMAEALLEADRLAEILRLAVPTIEKWWPEIEHRIGNLRGRLEFEWQLHVDIDDAKIPDHLAPDRATGMAHAMHLNQRRREYARNFLTRRVEMMKGYEDRLVEVLSPALPDVEEQFVLQLARQCSWSVLTCER